MSDLTAALAYPTVALRKHMDEALRVRTEAARKWAELEAQVADGARVVVISGGCLDPLSHGMTCAANDIRVILGEGSEQ